MSGSFASVFGISLALSAVTIMGPNLFSSVVAREVSRHGVWAGPLVLLGRLALEAPFAVGLAVVLAGPLNRGGVENALWFAGGLYLVWTGAWTAALSFGWGDLFQHRSEGPARQARPVRAAGLVGTGMLATVVEPLWFAWWLAAGALMAWSSGGALERLAAVGGGLALAEVLWLTFIAAAVASGRKVMDGSFHRALGAACGVAMIGFGAAFLHTAVGDAG